MISRYLNVPANFTSTAFSVMDTNAMFELSEGNAVTVRDRFQIIPEPGSLPALVRRRWRN